MRKLTILLALVLAMNVLPVNILAAEETATLIPLTEEHVTIADTRFVYTGEPIEPEVVVTVEGSTLLRDTDYAVEYINNLIPGTGTVIVRGILTASETVGYEGEVRIDFTITEAPESEETPETSEPEETPETSEPEEDKPSYKLTKGDCSTWFQGSSSGLSFTADGPFDSFTGVSVNGKELAQTDFDAKAGTTVLLKNAYLKGLDTGSYTITLHFAEDVATGTFTIAAEDENPKTGDAIGQWLMLMLFSGTALTAARKHFA